MRFLVVLLVVEAACTAGHTPHSPLAPPPPSSDRPSSAPPPAVNHKAALEDAVAHPSSFTGAPCDIDAPKPPPPFNDLFSNLDGADDTYWLMRDYVHMTGSIFEIINAAQAPFRPIELDAPQVTLVIDRFADPVMTDPRPDRTVPSGELRGRVLVWHDDVLACGADVVVHNSIPVKVPAPIPATADISVPEYPLVSARVDLVNEALRAGLVALHKPSH
jgi:hypothetical protein